MKYAVIELGGKQYKVEEGTTFETERQEKLNMNVLMYSDGKSVVIGDPIAKDIEVKASILNQKLDKKVRVARYKSKSRYRKVKGHRQPISVVRIDSITVKGAKASKPKATKTKAKKEGEDK
jgi:large subunit ribosomal protein L21